MRRLLIITPLALALGCGSEPPAATAPVSPPTRVFEQSGSDPWALTSTKSRTEATALLWNGLIGMRIGPSAMGTALNGAELPAFDIAKYQQDGEEKILPQSNPLQIAWKVGGLELVPSTPTDYKQVLDLKRGLIITTWSQETQQGGETRIRVQTLLHPTSRVAADRWEIEPTKPCQVSYTAEPGTWSSSNLFAIEPRPMVGEAVYRVTGNTGSFDIGAKEALVLERTISPQPVSRRWTELRSEVERAWADRWETDIEIDGPVEDQQAVRSWMFYLRSAIHPDGNMAVSPMGLSSAQYNGHVFWDADVWVFPALAFIDPEAAKEIPEYRLSKLAQARKNFDQWMSEGRPVGNGRELGTLAQAGEFSAAMFPWESSVSGKETVPGQSKFQHHISGTVAFGLGKAHSLGFVETNQFTDLVRQVHSFYENRGELSKDGGGLLVEIKDTMSPDEFHTGHNDLYTNLVAQWVANDGTWTAFPSYRTAPTYKLTQDDQTFLTYDNDPVKAYKQAAAVLAIYPLQYPPAEAQARVMMERFADKVTDNGPAMTDSVHALIWARLGETDKAYETWQKSWKEFSYPPHLLFSEKRRSEKTYFTTGAGGCLQTVIYGFLGFRIDSQKLPGAAWTTQLKGGNWLSIKPNLPKAWKKVTFKNFKVLGKSYTLTATHDSVEVTEGA